MVTLEQKVKKILDYNKEVKDSNPELLVRIDKIDHFCILDLLYQKVLDREAMEAHKENVKTIIRNIIKEIEERS